jgi:hypothetical protein
MLTHRQARRKLGSRNARRAGTKTKVVPGSGNAKQSPKYRYPRARPISLAARVAKLVQASR